MIPSPSLRALYRRADEGRSGSSVFRNLRPPIKRPHLKFEHGHFGNSTNYRSINLIKHFVIVHIGTPTLSQNKRKFDMDNGH